MDRRGFIKLAPIAAAGACATSPRPVAPAAGDLSAFFRTFDAAMAEILAWRPLQALVSNVAGEKVAERASIPAADEQLARKALRTVLLAGSFRDLVESEQNHPDMRARIDQHLPEMADALYGVIDRMQSIPEARAKAIRAKLTEDPEIPLRIAEVIDQAASTSGVSKRRRLQLRAMTLQAGFRLRTQPLAAFADEAADKVKRVAERQKAMHTAAVTADAEKNPVATGTPPAAPVTPADTKEKTHKTLSTAGILLGIGAGTTLLGVVTAENGGIGLLLITFGVLTLMAGLITLLVAIILEILD